MAFIQQKYHADTTEKKLRKFLFQSILFVWILTSFTLLFCVISEVKYEKASKQQLELNSFYLNFDQLHSDLFTYCLNGDNALLQSIRNNLERLNNSMETLEGLKISTIYQRDIEDVSKMFSNYEKCVDMILLDDRSSIYDSRSNSGIVKVNQAYYKAKDYYQSINSEFRSLYSQILESGRKIMDQMKLSQHIFIYIIILLLIFMIAAELIYSIALSHEITDPIKELTLSIRDFYKTELIDCEMVSISTSSNEEMNILVQVFNRMLQTMKEQFIKIRENADTEIKLQQKEMENLQITNLLRSSELKALQMQINPHFLFNTLNMISQTAYLEGADGTSVLLDSTASLLRYTMDFAAREVPLSKEIEILGLYVSLQEQRFGDRIRFIFELDETFHHIKVPALILQPIVENSIIHGVGMYLSNANIIIRTEYDSLNNTGIIQIIDNGVGMNKKQLEIVRSELECTENLEQKIGLSNVYARLKIFFNDKASMEINSISGRETVVTICIPCFIS